MQPIAIVARVLLGVGALLVALSIVLPFYRYTAEISGDSAVQIATAAQTENLVQASFGKAALLLFGGGVAVVAIVAYQSSTRAVTLALGGLATVMVIGAVVWAIADKPAGPDDANGLDRTFRTIDIQMDTSIRLGGWVALAGALLILAGTVGLGASPPPERRP